MTGAGLTAPVTGSETITADTSPQLSAIKSISPATVTENSRVIYTFVIRNTGASEITAADNAVITDTFDPMIADPVAVFNGKAWTAPRQLYAEPGNGGLTTGAGQITVPAATVTQDPLPG